MHRTTKPFATIIDREIARAFELGYRAAGGKGDAEQARRDFMERGGISADDLEEFFDRITPEQRDKLREVRAIVENGGDIPVGPFWRPTLQEWRKMLGRTLQ